MKLRHANILLAILMAVVFAFNFSLASSTNGSIDATYKHAWSENIGWINFAADSSNVSVTDSTLTGHAWSESYGWINLAPSTSGVKNNGEGTLSGYAWGENTGWINFSGVTINSSGEFLGYAEGDVTGTISFNCSNTSSCGSSDFKVTTDWRPQSSRPACNNAQDDDSDGAIDYPSDIGCDSLDDTDETNTTVAPTPTGGGSGGSGSARRIAQSNPKEDKGGSEGVDVIIQKEPFRFVEFEGAETTGEKVHPRLILLEKRGVAAVIFNPETRFTYSDGSPFTEEISNPAITVFPTTPPPGQELVGDVYEVGFFDTELYFDKSVTLRLPLPVDADPRDEWGIYYWNTESSEWIIVGDGGEVKVFDNPDDISWLNAEGLQWFNEGNKFVIEVELDHFTKFAVMKPEQSAVEPPVSTVGDSDDVEIEIIGREALPEQLFDINLELDDTTLEDSDDLSARLIFVSFGSVPTPVDLTFSIVDESGVELYREEDRVVVETELVLEKTFKDLNLPFGAYTLIVETLYNVNVYDEFRQSFELAPEAATKPIWQSPWLWIALLLILLIFIRRRRNSTKKKVRKKKLPLHLI